MPIISQSTYVGPPSYYLNGHFETILPSLFRKVDGVVYRRERIYTPDGDFLDLDWSSVGSNKLLIVSHGLEGSSDRHYAKGLVRIFNANHIDVLVWNNRSCSGEINIRPVLYHHGSSGDLEVTIQHVLQSYGYNELFLSGISMGGAQVLKYLGEKGEDVPNSIKKAAVYSTPCNLADSAATLKFRSNAFYRRRFLGKLKAKVALKATQFPELIDLQLLDRIQDFDSFDTAFTARLHGFADARDFYQSVSADRWMHRIIVPTLVVNAQNDPLLQGACYPIRLAESNPFLLLEMPRRGGHTGFIRQGELYTWAEQRVAEFLLDSDLPRL